MVVSALDKDIVSSPGSQHVDFEMKNLEKNGRKD
jgi:hypothetical protein